MKKREYKADSVKLGTVISVEGMRDVLDTADSDINLSEHIRDADTSQLQGQIMDQMAEFGLEIEDMQQVEEALDVPILDDDLEDGASEELEMMEQMAAGSVSDEQVDIEDDVNADSTKVDETEELADIEDDLEGTLDV
jgi:hypothetical protein